MEQRDRGPGTTPRRGNRGAKPKPSSPVEPGEVETRRKNPPGIRDAGELAEVRQPESSEDFGGRRDIETADEPPEQHDRRHHDGHRSDVESTRPV